MSARQSHKFSDEFHIHVAGNVCEVHGRERDMTRSTAQTPALHFTSSATLSARCLYGKLMWRLPCCRCWAGEGLSATFGRGLLRQQAPPELRRIALQPPCPKPSGQVRGWPPAWARLPTGRGAGFPCLLPEQGLCGCTAASLNFPARRGLASEWNPPNWTE